MNAMKTPRCAHSAGIRWAGLLLATLALPACWDMVPDESGFAGNDGGKVVDGTGDDADADTPPDSMSDGIGDTGAQPDIADTADKVDGEQGDAVKADTPTPVDTGGCKVAKDCGESPDSCQVWSCTAGQCKAKALPAKSKCDDGDPCTKSANCDDKGTCIGDPKSDICACHVSADCKDDKNVCNGQPYCDTSEVPYNCKTNPASVVDCSHLSAGACELVKCKPDTGECLVKAVADTQPPKLCDDGNGCTASDHCKAGSCVGGANTCVCVKDADCAGKEDGDTCNGTLYCDLSAGKPKCVINPATVVTCPGAGADPCAPVLCDKKSGKCTAEAKPDLTPCDDGQVCTKGDVCEDGSCKSGTDLCGCKQDADCQQFDDGDLCNGALYCDKKAGACKVHPGTIIHCSKAGSTDCMTMACAPALGVCKPEFAIKFSQCNADDNPCTVDDTCDGFGSCLTGTNTCVCETNDDCKSKEDGNACNGTLYCDKLQNPPTCLVNPTTVVVCTGKDDGPCKKNTCDKKTGKCAMKKSADLSKCDDGKPCTVGDICKAGSCKGGTDLCACKADADCIDDGNACNGTPYCDTAASPPVCKTKPASAVACTEASQGCKKTTCNPSTGKCGLVAVDSACDDKNPCTVDICGPKGKCSHGSVVNGSVCTAGAETAKICHDGQCLALAPAMIYVPDGPTQMGCNAALDGACKPDEKPQHEVQLSAFFIDRFEITVDQYGQCVDAGNCAKPKDPLPKCNWGDKTKAQHPMNCIDHDAAVAVCQHFGKRLLTEAEWEKAARGGCEIWGKDCAKLTPTWPWAKPAANCSFTVMLGVDKGGCDLGTTRSVGTMAKDISPYGVRDMGGNVSEWVSDGYQADWYSKSPKKDPHAPAKDGRVVRGGSLVSTAAEVRAGNRQSSPKKSTDPALGVRCAKDVPKAP